MIPKNGTKATKPSIEKLAFFLGRFLLFPRARSCTRRFDINGKSVYLITERHIVCEIYFISDSVSL